jgi:hypothetical protein
MPILLGTIGREIEKAVLFNCKAVKASDNALPYEWNSQSWWPLSQITRIVKKSAINSEDELHVSEWIAEKKGLYEELD